MALSAGQLALQNSKKEKQGYDVFVRNLLEDTKTEDLYAFFEPAGKIIRAPRLNLGRGFAWITFDSMEAVAQAVVALTDVGEARVHVPAVPGEDLQHPLQLLGHLGGLASRPLRPPAELVGPGGGLLPLPVGGLLPPLPAARRRLHRLLSGGLPETNTSELGHCWLPDARPCVPRVHMEDKVSHLLMRRASSWPPS